MRPPKLRARRVSLRRQRELVANAESNLDLLDQRGRDAPVLREQLRQVIIWARAGWILELEPYNGGGEN